MSPAWRVEVWSLLLVVPPLLVVAPGGVAAQQRIGPDAPPDSVATGFETALRAGAWRTAAGLMDPEGLEGFRRLLRLLTEADPQGEVLETLLPGSDAKAVSELRPTELFVSMVEALTTEMPGVLHALSAREVTILGTVREGSDLAHVLYRNRDLLQGAAPEIRVLTLRSGDDGWKVLESDELDLIREAMRGLARTRATSPGQGE